MRTIESNIPIEIGRYLAIMAALLLISGTAVGQETTDLVAAAYRTAGAFDFGGFCVEKIPSGSVTRVGRPRLFGNGQERSVTLRFGPGRKAKVYFFENSRPEAGIFDTCGEGVSGQTRRILEGSIQEGTIEFRMVEPQGEYGRAVMIAKGDLNLRLSEVKTNFSSLYGGAVVPGDVEVKVSNVEEFSSDAGKRNDSSDDRLHGTLSVGSYRLGLANAQVLLPGFNTPVVVSFSAVPKGRNLKDVEAGVVFHVDLPSGAIRLAAGGLVSTAPVDAGNGVLKVAGAEAMVTSGILGEARLVMRPGEIEPWLELHRLSLDVASASYGGAGGVSLVPTEAVQIETIFGSAVADHKVAAIGEAAALGLMIPAAELAMGGTQEHPALEGLGSLKLARLSKIEIEGESKVAVPSMPVLASLVPITGQDLLLHFSGAPAALRIDGSLALSALKLASLTFAEVEETRADFVREPGAVTLPFKISGKASQGRWSFKDSAGEAVLEGRLGGLHLAGSLSWNPTLGPRLTIEPNGLGFEAKGTTVLRPIFFGAPPEATALSGSVEFASAEGFTIARDGAQGSVQLSAEIIAATGAGLTFGRQAEGRFRIDQPIAFAAGATIDFRLSDYSVSLLAGRARIDNLSAVAEGEQPVHLAGLALAAPRVSAERLEVNATQGVATVTAVGLQFAADRIDHPSDPIWHLEAVEPRLPRVEARLGQAGQALVLEEASVHDFSLIAARGFYRSRDGFTIAGEDARVEAKYLSPQRFDSGRITIGHGSLRLDVTEESRQTFGEAGFRDFEVSIEGEKEHLAGTGRFRLEGLRFHHDFSILQNANCENELQLRALLDIGDVDVDLRLQDAALEGGATLHSAGYRVVNTSKNGCEWNDSYTVDIFRLTTESVCWIPIIKEICKEIRRVVKIPVTVPVRWRAKVRHLDISGSVEEVDLQLRGDRGVTFCLRKTHLNPGGFQFFAVTPTFEASGDVGRLIKGVVDLSLEATLGLAESSFSNSVLNVGGLATAIFSVNHCQ